jgi:hypothetical protein
METHPAKLHIPAHSKLKELQTAPKSEGVPGKVSQEEILSALVMYTSLPQLAGMLAAYSRYTAHYEREKEA